MPHFKSEGSFTPDRLVIGEYRARKVTIKAGAGVRSRGDFLGKVTADNKYILSVAAANDGSQFLDGILSENVDATSADVEAVVYICGDFDVDAVTFGAGHTAANADRQLRQLGFFLAKTQG